MSEHDRELAAGAALGALSPEDAARLEEEARRKPALADGARGVPRDRLHARGGDRAGAAPEDSSPASSLAIETSTPAGAPRPPSRRAPRALARRSRRLWPAFAVGARRRGRSRARSRGFGGRRPRASRGPSGGQRNGGVPRRPRRGEAVRAEPGRREARPRSRRGTRRPRPASTTRCGSCASTSDGEMEAVGVFSPTDAAVELEFRLPGPGEYEAVDVSVEPDGGPAEHSGRSLAGGRFEQSTS